MYYFVVYVACVEWKDRASRILTYYHRSNCDLLGTFNIRAYLIYVTTDALFIFVNSNYAKILCLMVNPVDS